MGSIHLLVLVCIVIGTTVSGWIVTLQVRRRIRQSLGKRASSLELVSLRTWMRVDEAEQQRKESGPIHPR